jgi:hypothetical protein
MKNPWDKIEKPDLEISTLRADPLHPLDFSWAKDHLDNYLFVYEYPSNSEIILNDVPDLLGIETNSTYHNDVARLIFSLREKDDWEIFHDLCLSLMASTHSLKDIKKAPIYILKRLKSWHRFLQKNKSKILKEEAIKGLIGELLFLKNWVIPKYGINESIKFWIGPESTPQDFAVNKTAIEVKCQFGGTSPRVKISSGDQLFTQLQNLILYVVTLGKTTPETKDRINLPNLIEEIEGMMNDASSLMINRFQDLLLEVGYRFSEKYFDYNYIFSNEQAFVVKEDFPRIVPEDLKDGILNLNYTINLSDCSDYKIDIENWGEDH